MTHLIGPNLRNGRPFCSMDCPLYALGRVEQERHNGGLDCNDEGGICEPYYRRQVADLVEGRTSLQAAIDRYRHLIAAGVAWAAGDKPVPDQVRAADTRPQRHGWAPGGYVNQQCVICGGRFCGDKRATWCAPCAYNDPIDGERLVYGVDNGRSYDEHEVCRFFSSPEQAWAWIERRRRAEIAYRQTMDIYDDDDLEEDLATDAFEVVPWPLDDQSCPAEASWVDETSNQRDPLPRPPRGDR